MFSVTVAGAQAAQASEAEKLRGEHEFTIRATSVKDGNLPVASQTRVLVVIE